MLLLMLERLEAIDERDVNGDGNDERRKDGDQNRQDLMMDPKTAPPRLERPHHGPPDDGRTRYVASGNVSRNGPVCHNTMHGAQALARGTGSQDHAGQPREALKATGPADFLLERALIRRVRD